jgi:hypothetical protein
MVKFEFASKDELADHLEEKAKSIRSRVPNASRNSQHVMRAEAHAYEQSAMMIRNSVFADVEAEWHASHPEGMGR